MAQFDLPQLTNKDAVDYLCAEKDDQALRDTIEAAQLNETPFYLTIAERLLQAERLDGWTGDDTTTLRVALLDRYIEALHDERLLPDAELRPGERESVVRELSDVACAMLRRGRASVPLTKIEEWADEEREDQPVDAHTIVGGGRALELFDLVGQETGQFTHSVMQSYLASRRLRQNPARASDLLGDPASNELLTAIVMAAAWRNEGESDLDRRGRGRELADILLKRARERRDSSALALVIAAARIVGACGLGSTLADEVIEHAEECWQQASASTRVAGIVALSELDTRRLFGQILSGALGDADFEVRLAAAKSLGDGGDSAYEALRPKIKRTLDVASNGRLQLEERRELGNYGYVLPLLRRDGGAGHVAEVDKLIEVVEKGVDPRVEATIARGFKRDALRNPSREVDMKRICDLVDKAGWWYSKICLLHALVRRADAGDDVAARRVVESCISNSSEHPFVQEAARQCLTALDVGDVERWIWANESEVVNHARPTRPRAATDADELAVEAVQLAADVALAMNLTFSLEIDPGWDDAERQSQQDARVTAWLRTRELPYCMARSRDRHEVFPDEGVCPRECVHGFCPQKLEGSGSFRTEFSEAFCRQQRDAPPRRGQRPSWQRGFRRRRGLKQFWDRMAEEARHASATRPRTPR